ncbi:hypothetical protein [Shewanella sp. MBTL60-007]|uniref:hypothetical protein n=1 Tax=Shewanella sp. MBTL60-007 TaxID=2815911 RepID=UPI001BC48A8F|nr:hypothetical protein [Shewanella sp. MBTL60-007]GIU22076.1 hypothetical protein TUM3792_23700 [Shewanella sp. MBTL60-007]
MITHSRSDFELGGLPSFVEIGTHCNNYWAVSDTADYAKACALGEQYGREYLDFKKGRYDDDLTLADIFIAMNNHNEGFKRGFAFAIDRLIANV